ncbi:MAG: amidohydrolase, partial [Pseudomonadales bacterium]
PVISPFFDQASQEAVLVTDRGLDQLVRRDAAKIFVDGVLEGETAALLEPYLGESPHSGMLVTPPEALNALVVEMDSRQIQMMFHAIGDRGVRVALDAVEAAQNVNGDRGLRHHISHLQMIDPVDRPRFKALGVSANFQALWALPDGYIMEINLPAVGEQRVSQMYPIGSLEAEGARIVGGSDWPISSMNPLAAIETAITRADAEGKIPGTLNLAEAVSLETMLRAYTLEGAFLMHQELVTGSLEVGKQADLVVLSENLFDVDVARISDVAVERTFFSGQQVYPK